MEKGRTPKNQTDAAVGNGYFDIPESTVSIEGNKTPTAVDIKGKGRSGATMSLTPFTATMGESSENSDVGRVSLDTDRGLETTTETEGEDDSEVEAHSPTSSPEMPRPQLPVKSQPLTPASSSHSRAATTPEHHPAEDSFVLVEPPTPNAAMMGLRTQESFRPSFYHQASRSLVNLSSAADRRMDAEREQEQSNTRDRLNRAAGGGLRLENLPKPSVVQNEMSLFVASTLR